VAEFAAGARGFAVEMEGGVGDGEDLDDSGRSPMRIEHGAVAGGSRGAEGQAEDGAEMVFRTGW